MLKGKLKTQPLTQAFAANTLTPKANKITRGMSGFCVATGFEHLSVQQASDHSGKKYNRPELLSE